MAPTKPRGPRTLKGALISIASNGAAPSIIAFQYNPTGLRRSLRPLMVGGEEGDRSEAVRYTGAPVETIDVDVVIDATDALESGDEDAVSVGIHPLLAALELLVYPPSGTITANDALLNTGTLEIAPMSAPRTLFVWGPQRVVPVRLLGYSVAEEEFDAKLNPIRATVSLQMRVLTYSDLVSSNPDYHQYLAHQTLLESLAPRAMTHGTQQLGAITITS
jgi:hypothetical protein